MPVATFSVFLLMATTAFVIAASPLVSAPAKRNRGSVRISLLAIGLVILMGIGLYAVLGRPGVESPIHAGVRNGASMSGSVATSSGQKPVGSVASLVTGLEERLKADPDDGKGWLLLAKSYEHLGRIGEARDAYRRAVGLGATDPALDARLSTAVAAPESARITTPINGRVALAASLRDRVAASDTVFVIARAAADSSMPIAVLKRKAGDLPFDFTLSDANSMTPGRGLSSVPSVVITARISSTGDALAAEPGIGAVSAPVDTRNPVAVDLVIAADTNGDGSQ